MSFNVSIHMEVVQINFHLELLLFQLTKLTQFCRRSAEVSEK